MNSRRRSTEPLHGRDNNCYELQPVLRSEPHIVHSPSPPSPHDLLTSGGRTLTAKLLMALPLIIHFIGSIAILIGVSMLNGQHYYLERQPRIQLANGTYESQPLGKYHVLQSDITTIISVSLMVVRWIAAAWAVPLCWRAIFLLAERSGLCRRDIEWVVNYAILPPTTQLKRPRNRLLGLILICTLAPYPSSPLLTGSISWLPSSLTVDLPYHPTLTLTGSNLDYKYGLSYSPEYKATFSTDLIKNINAAWTKDTEEHIFKRVIPSAAQLAINSTIDNALIPYFSVTRIKWLPEMGDNVTRLFDAMDGNHQKYPDLIEKMNQPGAIVLIDPIRIGGIMDWALPTSWPLLINIGKELFGDGHGICNSTTMILPPDTSIQHLSFSLDIDHLPNSCFAYANVSFTASFGLCNNCRVSSYSTVQNTTELYSFAEQSPKPIATREGGFYADLIRLTVLDMPTYIPSVTPLKNSFPDPVDDIDAYITALLTRVYSALWNSWIDASGYDSDGPSPGYKSAVPTLRVEVSEARVWVWFSLQLLLTLAGLAFLWLQWRSRHPLISDTRMVAFDIDSTEAPKHNPSSKTDSGKNLRIEPKGGGWKVIIAS